MTASNGWSVVFLIALLAPAGLILNGLVQRRRSAQASPGWLSGILVLLTGLAGGALAIVSAFGRADALFLAGLLVLGAAELIVGLAVWALLERHSGAAHSFGILAAALGGLTAVMALILPTVPGQLILALATPTLPATRVVAVASLTPDATLPVTLAPSPTVTGTATPTPQPSATSAPTATPTRVRYMTPTPSTTPTLFPVCGAVAEYNVNLRAHPSLDAAIVNVIPYQSVVEIAARDLDGAWWFARYEGEWGWLDGRYITLDTDCSQAPVLAD